MKPMILVPSTVIFDFNLGKCHVWLPIVTSSCGHCLQNKSILLFIHFALNPRFFQTFSLSVEIDLFSLELSGFFVIFSAKYYKG